ncbi:tat pathway signal sequence [Rhizophagus clarus]|nr:tat pathway signal sequence [Rhizophagus clarus]
MMRSNYFPRFIQKWRSCLHSDKLSKLDNFSPTIIRSQIQMDKSNELSLLTNALFKTLTAPEGKIVEFPELENTHNVQNTDITQSIQSEKTPLVINIFDFDGTLFSSPEPNPAIWENKLVGHLKNENVIFKGWYQDRRSLSFGNQDRLNNRWNYKLVNIVKNSMKAENTLTVLLTGRNYDEFHELITEMVERKGMRFDVMGFKPTNNIIDWRLYYKPNIIEKIGRDMYEKLIMNQTITGTQKLTTKEFKMHFIGDLISHHPPPISINIWEDRPNHFFAFEAYLEKLKSLGKIKEGTVHKVFLSKNFLEPFREYDIVMGMIKDHNYRSEQINLGKIGIVRKIQYAGIFFDQQVIDKLKRIYPPPTVNREWVFDGPYVLIKKNVSNEWLKLHCEGRGAIVTMKITGFGIYQNRIYCLQVSEYENSLEKTPIGMRCGKLFSDCPVPFINFAYVKGTEGFINTENINFNWIKYDKQIVVQGIIAAKYILGLE